MIKDNSLLMQLEAMSSEQLVPERKVSLVFSNNVLDSDLMVQVGDHIETAAVGADAESWLTH